MNNSHAGLDAAIAFVLDGHHYTPHGLPSQTFVYASFRYVCCTSKAASL
jgi:hypothetical protein